MPNECPVTISAQISCVLAYLLGFLIHPVNIHENVDELLADVLHHLHGLGFGLLLKELAHVE